MINEQMKEDLKTIFTYVIEEIEKDKIVIPVEGDNIIDYYIKACFYADKKDALTKEQIDKFIATPVADMLNLYTKYFLDYYIKAGLGYFEEGNKNHYDSESTEEHICKGSYFSQYGLSIKLIKRLVDYKITIAEVIKFYNKDISKKTLDFYYSLINLLCVFHSADNIFNYIEKYMFDLKNGNEELYKSYTVDVDGEVIYDYNQIVHDLGNMLYVNKIIPKKYISLFMQKPSALKTVGRVFTSEYFEGMPHTLNEFNKWFEEIYKNTNLYKTAEYSLSDEQWQDINEYMESTKSATKRIIPDVHKVVDKYRISTVPLGHIDNLLIGMKVDCCQHYFSAAHSAAKFAYTQEQASIWAVYKGFKVIAEAFVWTVDGTIIIDSIESLVRTGSGAEKIAELFYVAVSDIIANNKKFKNAYIGDAGYGVNNIFKQKYTDNKSIKNNFHKKVPKLEYTNDSEEILLINT